MLSLLGLAIVERVFCACLATACPDLVVEQKNPGSVSGKVTDGQGVAVADASVRLSGQRGPVFRDQITDSSGNYRFLNVPSGTYTLEVYCTGYKRVKTDVDVVPPSVAEKNFELQPGSSEEQLVLAAEPSTIDTRTATLSQSVTREMVDALPTGASVMSLTAVIPGVTGVNASGLHDGRGSINGALSISNNFSVDGVDLQDSVLSGGQEGAFVPRDAVELIARPDPFSAQSGTSVGGGANVTSSGGTLLTREGQNTFHGALFRNLGNELLNAENAFSREEPGTDTFRHDVFGASLGGPVVKNRAHFFLAYEGRRDRTDAVFLGSRITPADLNRAVENVGGTAIVNRLSQAVLARFDQRDVRLGRASIENDLRSDSLLIKGNASSSPRHRLVGEYVLDRDDRKLAVPLHQPGYRTLIVSTRNLVSLNHDWVVNAQTLNTLQGSYHRAADRLQPEDSSFDPGTIGLVTGASGSDRGLPAIRIAGYDAIGAPVSIPRQSEPAETWQLTQRLTTFFGRHHLIAGGELRRLAIESTRQAGFRGQFYFPSLEDFLIGRVGIGRIARGDSRRETTLASGAWYVQDVFRPVSELTLKLGLRWEHTGVPSEKRGQLYAFQPGAGGLVAAGSPGLPHIYEPDLNNFAPRLAVAWAPGRRDRVAFRAGYGLHYVAPSTDFFLGQAAPNSVAGGAAYAPTGPAAVQNVSRYDFQWMSGLPTFGSTNQLPPPYDVFVVDPGLRTPYVHHYTGNVQYAIARGMRLQAGYIGSSGRQLFRIRDLNQPTPGPAATANLRRPFAPGFPDLAVINVLETTGTSKHDSWQITLDQRGGARWSTRINYTWSRAVDDASDAIETGLGRAFPQDSQNPGAERAPSSFDIRHRLNAAVDYVIPPASSDSGLLEKLRWGWQASALIVLQSGPPFTVGTLRNPSGTNEFADRPDLVGSPVPASQTGERILDAAAFSDNYRDRFGQLGRNAFRGPGLTNVDLVIVKEIRFNLPFELQRSSRDYTLQLRAEILNLFNRTNYAVPENLLSEGDPLFGQVRMTRDVASLKPGTIGGPRIVQVGVRVIF